VVNGDFATADDWIIEPGSGWAIGSGKATHTPGTNGLITQVVPTLIYGYTYRVTFDVLDRTAGSVFPQLGEGPGSTQGSSVSTNATHTDFMTFVEFSPGVDNNISFNCSTDFDGSIDNVILEAVLYCYNGEGWVYSETSEFYTHLPGTAVALLAQSPFISAGKWYQVTFEITNRTAGSVRAIVGANASEWLSQDGTFTRVIYSATSTQSGFDCDTDFDGSVRMVSTYEMSIPSRIDLVDASDTTSVIADLIPYYTLDGDRVNVKFSIEQLQSDGAIPGNILLPVCYRIVVDSVCSPIGGNMVTNGTFTGGSGTTIAGWTPINAPSMAVYDFSNMQVERTGPSDPLAPRWRNTSNPEMTAGNYLLVFNITKNTNVNSIAVRFLLDGVMASPWFSTMGTGLNYLFEGYEPNQGAPINNQSLIVEYSFSYDGVIVTGQIAIDTVRLFKYTSSVQPKVSNCITIMSDEDLSCHKELEAWSECLSGGFDFRNFRLRMLVPMLKWGSKYPIKETTYIYSNGTNERPQYSRDKTWQVKTDRVDEITHDCLSLMLLQENFTSDGRSYFLKGGKYDKDDARNGLLSLSKASFEMADQVSVVFGNKCRDCDNSVTPVDCIDACADVLGYIGEEGIEAGWFADPESNELQYWNGSEFTDSQDCTGYIYVDGEMLKWNDVTNEWENFIEILSLSDDGSTVTLRAVIPSGCAAQIQVTVNNGGEWTNASTFKTAEQLYAGVEFDMPEDPFWIILKVNCGPCTYYSPINETYGE
jgi:hypothetical protein